MLVTHDTLKIRDYKQVMYCPNCGSYTRIESDIDVRIGTPEFTQFTDIDCHYMVYAYCPSCGQMMVNIDPEIFDYIKYFNDHGYETLYSCESHFEKRLVVSKDNEGRATNMIKKFKYDGPYIIFISNGKRRPLDINQRFRLYKAIYDVGNNKEFDSFNVVWNFFYTDINPKPIEESDKDFLLQDYFKDKDTTMEKYPGIDFKVSIYGNHDFVESKPLDENLAWAKEQKYLFLKYLQQLAKKLEDLKKKEMEEKI